MVGKLEKLAIEGGEPVRRAPLPPHPMFTEEEIEAVVEVLRARTWGGFMSTKVREFEEEFARYHGVKHAISVSSGTAALHLALAGIDVGPGDEVILPPYTFISTANAILHNNAIPIFADVDSKTGNIDPTEIEKKISDRTKAVLPVHMLGQPADMDPIMEVAEKHDLYVIEDCAQAAGAEYKDRKVGTIGHIGAFSFQDSKNMTTGEGGMVITNREELAEKVWSYRNHCRPRTSPYPNVGPWNVFWGIGWNLRMTALEAAIGSVQLGKLDMFNEQRIRNAKYITRSLEDLDGIEPPYVIPEVKHVYWEYGSRVDPERLGSRDRLAFALAAEGIYPVGGYCPIPVHLQDLFTRKVGYGETHCPFNCPFYGKKIEYMEGLCPRAEKMAKEDLLLPVYPALTGEDLSDVVKALEKVVRIYAKEKSS